MDHVRILPHGFRPGLRDLHRAMSNTRFTGVTFKQAQKVEPKLEAEQGKLDLTGL